MGSDAKWGAENKNKREVMEIQLTVWRTIWCLSENINCNTLLFGASAEQIDSGSNLGSKGSCRRRPVWTQGDMNGKSERFLCFETFEYNTKVYQTCRNQQPKTQILRLCKKQWTHLLVIPLSRRRISCPTEEAAVDKIDKSITQQINQSINQLINRIVNQLYLKTASLS